MSPAGDDPTTLVTEASVRAAASHAELPLSDERVAAVTALLRAWLPAANALSARMRGGCPEFRGTSVAAR